MTETGFSVFDEITGGLQTGRDYLLYGSIGAGKSSFALSFLHHGLACGEASALVTRRSPRAVLDQARTLGWDLDPHVRSGRLTLLEYPEDLHEHTSVLREANAIFHSFRETLGGVNVRRLVFDPVTPLLVVPGATYQGQRARNLMRSVAELEATTLYVIDTPEGDAHLSGCKDQVFGMLRFEARGETRQLAIERLPGASPRQTLVTFDVRAGAGLTAADAPSAAPLQLRPTLPAFATAPEVEPGLPTAAAWRQRYRAGGERQASRQTRRARWLALLASPSEEERTQWRAALEPQATILEARGPAECVGAATSEAPELILVSQNMKGLSAIELIQKLRSVEVTAPVVLIGSRLRRLNDRVRALEAGADLALDAPADLRLLRLHARMLLGRSGGPAGAVQRAAETFVVATAPARPKLACTGSLDQFVDRVRSETSYALAADVAFVLVALQAATRETGDEIASICAFLSREDDLTYSGPRGAAVLLTESADADAFLARFHQRWRGAARPAIYVRPFDGSPTFADETEGILAEALEDPTEREVQSLTAAMAAAMGAPLDEDEDAREVIAAGAVAGAVNGVSALPAHGRGLDGPANGSAR